MGGRAKVMTMADEALQGNDSRWAIHLLAKLADSGMAPADESLNEKMALAYEKLAEAAQPERAGIYPWRQLMKSGTASKNLFP